MNTKTIRRATKRGGLATILTFASLILVACASAPLPPAASLDSARDAIGNAEQAEARQYAGAELEEANRQLAAAVAAVAEERMAEADRLARQARIAAELAMARTEAMKAAAINREMGRGAEALDEEMQRQEDQQ